MKVDNFNHKNTLSISSINPPKFGGGLKFETVEAKRRSRPSGTQRSNKRGVFQRSLGYGLSAGLILPRGIPESHKIGTDFA